eukprot:3079307-Rhodomonas_salina.2
MSLLSAYSDQVPALAYLPTRTCIPISADERICLCVSVYPIRHKPVEYSYVYLQTSESLGMLFAVRSLHVLTWGTDIAVCCYQRTSHHYDTRGDLCTCYAMSGTNIAYDAMSFHAYPVMCGTDIAYAATSFHASAQQTLSRDRVGYRATRALCDVRYRDSVCCYALTLRCPLLTQRMPPCTYYAIPGTDIAYAAMSVPGSA